MHDDRLALILIEDDSRMRAQFLDVIAAEPSLRVASGASAAVDMLAWLAAKLVIALRPDSGSADRSSAAVAGRRSGTWEPSSIMEITLCADESSMRQAFETELSGHLVGEGSEAGRSFRVMSLHAGRSASKPIVAREVLAGRKAESSGSVCDSRSSSKAGMTGRAQAEHALGERLPRP